MGFEAVLKTLAGKKLLLLAGADPHRKIVEAAHELGIYVIVADYLPESESPAKRLADESWLVDVFDIDELVRRCRESGVDGVLNFCSDAPQYAYCKVCEKLGLPCFGTEEQFNVLRDKKSFRAYCADHGLLTVPSYTIDQALSGAAEFPLLVKPSAGRGSRGQTVCHGPEDVADAVSQARAFSLDDEVIIERYMAAYQDFGSSYFIIDGHPYPIKVGDRFLGTVESGMDRQQAVNISPSEHIQAYLDKTDPRVRRFIADLGITFGALFLQGFLVDGDVYYYDPGLRMPGSDFDVMVRNVTGFDSMTSAIVFALTGDVSACCGDPHDAYKLRGGKGLVLSVNVRPGVIGRIEGLGKLSRDPRVHCISERHHAGDLIRQTGDVEQRAIEVIGYVPDKEGLADFLDFVFSTVRVYDEAGEDMVICRVSYADGHVVVA